MLALSLIVLFSISFLSALVSAPASEEHGSPTNEASAQAFAASDVTLEVSPLLQILGQETTFYANATSDISGATLTFTIYYDYYNPDFSQNLEGGFGVATTGNPGQAVFAHTYRSAGNFTDFSGNPYHWVFVYVDDGSVNYSKSMKVYTNEAPWIYWADAPIFPAPGVPYDEYVFFIDNNSDMVNITWEWGDGTSSSQELQGLPLSLGGTMTFTNHTWNPTPIPGRSEYYVNYTMNITLSDGVNPTVMLAVNVSISFPYNVPPDFTTLYASASTVNPEQPVNFSAAASDYEGEALTWTFDYGDGLIDVFHGNTTASNQVVRQNATHAFASAGNFTVTVHVTDSVGIYQVGEHNASQSTIIRVVINNPPYCGSNITAVPTNPIINATLGYVTVVFQIDAGDLDNDPIHAVWDLGDGFIYTNDTTNGSRAVLVQSRQYSETGDFNVSVTITDGRPGHELVRNLTIHVTSNNRPPSPSLGFNYTQGNFGIPNESIEFTLVITDLEHDVIEVSWDFGDGSPVQWFNLTVFVDDNTTLVVKHAYTELKTYNMTITVTDNKVGLFNHTIVIKQPVVIKYQPQKKIIVWDWWDYTSLGLFMMMPVLVVARMVLVGRRRKKLEDQGISLEEDKLRKELHLDRAPKSPAVEHSPDEGAPEVKEEL